MSSVEHVSQLPEPDSEREPAGPFRSILCTGAPPEPAGVPEPEHFADLNLDRVVSAVVFGRRAYELEGYFRTPLTDGDAVAYRHEVFRDLEQPAVAAAVREFSGQLLRMRERLAHAEELKHRLQRQRVFAEAVGVYCAAVTALAGALDAAGVADATSSGGATGGLRSRALRGLRGHLAGLTASAGFRGLLAEAAELERALGEVVYTLHIKGDRVRVAPYEGEPDFSVDIEETFARFRQAEAPSHLVALPSTLELDDIEEKIVDRVARLFPEAFAALDAFAREHQDFLDPVLAAIDREAQFYLAYLDFSGRLAEHGQQFSLPELVDGSGQDECYARGAFDLALADKIYLQGAEAYGPGGGSGIVSNDFRLTTPERIIVVTGPNQGGKTTFARMFGQLHYLAGLGLPVPAAEARLMLPDGVFTHFEREEDPRNLRGKLDDELVRIHRVLGQLTARSVVVMNESFSSTTLRDARFIGEEVLRRIEERGAVCLYVTFVDELASLGETTVSMVGSVAEDDPAARTFRIVRRRADGLAHATALAEKYGLTYHSLRRRLR